MSDIDKVLGRARLLGPGTPIQLRWEGSGDSIHAAALLQDLQGRKYDDDVTPIKYNAVINVYEGKDDPITAAAIGNMADVHTAAGPDQTYAVWYNADVTRASRSVDQPKAHIIFVRNIMVTSGSGDSRTDASQELLSIHRTALRNRSNSLNDNSQIRLGMSGAPGLAIPGARSHGRGGMPVKTLFSGFDDLVTDAGVGGLALEGGKNRKGAKDHDLGEVMKNNGVSLGEKKTYYLTFHN
jgi:hypothetical protein